MDVMTKPSDVWEDTFHQLILTNCQFWLDQAQADPSAAVSERPQLLQALTYALSLLEAWPTARDLVQAVGPTLIRQGHGVAWEAYLVKAIERSQEEADPAEIEFRLELGNLYRLQGRLDEARDCLKNGLDLCEYYQVQTLRWSLINKLGLVARLLGRYDEAEAYCQRVIQEDHLTNVVDRAEAFNVVGLVACDRRQWDEALQNFNQALSFYDRSTDSYEIARLLTNRGVALQNSHKLDEAEQDYRAAIKQFKLSDEPIEIFKPITNLGNIFLLKEDYDEALIFYHQALPVFERVHFSVELAQVYNNLGLVRSGLENISEAESFFEAAIDIWDKLDDNYNLANVLDNKAKMYQKLQQMEQACTLWSRALLALSLVADGPAKTRLHKIITDRVKLC